MNKGIFSKQVEFLDIVEIVEIVLTLNSFGKYYSTIYLSKEFCERFNRRYEDKFDSYFHTVRFSTESLLYLLEFTKITYTGDVIKSTLDNFTVVTKSEERNMFDYLYKDYMQSCFRKAKILCEIEEETHFRDGLDWVLK